MKPAIFAITDVETTKKNGLVFDIGCRFVDRKGRVYWQGSFLIKDTFAHDNPFYREKMAQYFTQVWKQNIRPVTFRLMRRLYNDAVMRLQDKGHRIIFVAYNASFDVRQLGETSKRMIGENFMKTNVEFLDLWHAYCEHISPQFESELSDAFNWKTSAEAAFRFETKMPDFTEKHMGFSDTGIEADILLKKILPRKKKLHIVSDPKQFVHMPWKIAQKRIKTEKSDAHIWKVINRVEGYKDEHKLALMKKNLLAIRPDFPYSGLYEQ